MPYEALKSSQPFTPDDSSNESLEPLAARMRPRRLCDFAGQSHLVGEGGFLRRALELEKQGKSGLGSIVFWGPPGTGKTTLALLLAAESGRRFLRLSAVFEGLKELRSHLQQLRHSGQNASRAPILFIDEIHRWNKAQQDALLPLVETGQILLVGATTENPSFTLNNALLSRVRVLELSALAKADLRCILQRALCEQLLCLVPDAEDYLLEYCDGDARRLLGAVELLLQYYCPATPDKQMEQTGRPGPLGREDVREFLQRQSLYDRKGDYHYDTISAFIKSVRGSDVDSALYWLQVMLTGGEDPGFIWRRLLILAAEDIGLADPQALVQVEAATRAFERVGLPEGEYFLSQACIYLALCPKSSSVGAFWKAKEHLEKHGVMSVPLYLRSQAKNAARQKFVSSVGQSAKNESYLYPHNYRGHWVAQNYSSSKLLGSFYRPGEQGWEQEHAREHQRRTELLCEAQRLEVLQKQGRIDGFSSHELLLVWDELRKQLAQFGRRQGWKRLYICSGQSICHDLSVCDEQPNAPGEIWDIFPNQQANGTGDFLDAEFRDGWQELMRLLPGQQSLKVGREPISFPIWPSPAFLYQEWQYVCRESRWEASTWPESGMPIENGASDKFPVLVCLLGGEIEASLSKEISTALHSVKVYFLEEYSAQQKEKGAKTLTPIVFDILEELEWQLFALKSNHGETLRQKLGELRHGLNELLISTTALHDLKTFLKG